MQYTIHNTRENLGNPTFLHFADKGRISLPDGEKFLLTASSGKVTGVEFAGGALAVVIFSKVRQDGTVVLDYMTGDMRHECLTLTPARRVRAEAALKAVGELLKLEGCVLEVQDHSVYVRTSDGRSVWGCSSSGVIGYYASPLKKVDELITVVQALWLHSCNMTKAEYFQELSRYAKSIVTKQR